MLCVFLYSVLGSERPRVTGRDSKAKMSPVTMLANQRVSQRTLPEVRDQLARGQCRNKTTLCTHTSTFGYSRIIHIVSYNLYLG